MDKDPGSVGNQYNTMLSIFYAPCVVFAPPISTLGKKHGPNRVEPVVMLCFGSATLLAASVQNWSGMEALRVSTRREKIRVSEGSWVYVGMAESAFFLLVIYYLTIFYRRDEVARTLALFYTASNIATAFSGLLAFGVFYIKSNLQS
jgi:MFS family permease